MVVLATASRHSLELIPSEKLLGSNAGIDGMASMSPLWTSSTTIDPDWSPIRRAAYSCRSASMVICTGRRCGPASAQAPGSICRARYFDPLPAGLAAKRVFERFFKPFLADLHTGDEQQRVLVFFLIFLGRGGADIADQLPTADPAG